MDDAARLRQLIAELSSDDGYFTGRRRFPRTVTPADASAITGSLHVSLDPLTRRRADEARARGHAIACTAGCNACCKNPVMVFLPEAHRVADWLQRAENATAKAAFLAAYPTWRAAAGDLPERLAALTAAGDADQHLEAHVAFGRRDVMCAFNHEGGCTIYAVRPLLCRDAHALDTSASCDPSAPTGQPARVMEFVPLRDFLAKSRALGMALHHALGGERRKTRALCVAVYELLTSRDLRSEI